MTTTRLRPSDILYSQRSISNHFGTKGVFPEKKIGVTLDDIYEGRTCIEAIPRISVVYRDGDWISADNRRLWVFKNLESLGRCGHITVNVVDSIPNKKQTSTTAGESVQVRGDPGGYCHKKANLTEAEYHCSSPNAFGNDRPHSGHSTLLMEESPESSLGSTIATGVLIGGALLAGHYLFNRYKNKD